MIAYVQSLHIYPIKACQGVNLSQMEVTTRGPRGDRNWLIINPEGQFLGQRQHPELTQVEVFY